MKKFIFSKMVVVLFCGFFVAVAGCSSSVSIEEVEKREAKKKQRLPSYEEEAQMCQTMAKYVMGLYYGKPMAWWEKNVEVIELVSHKRNAEPEVITDMKEKKRVVLRVFTRAKIRTHLDDGRVVSANIEFDALFGEDFVTGGFQQDVDNPTVKIYFTD